MEEMENEYEKGVYWVIFFLVIFFGAFLGYELVFNNPKQEEIENEKDIVEVVDYDKYLGVWQLFGDDDVPEYELSVEMIDGSTITFDFAVKDVVSFESETASFDDDTARFELEDENGDKLIGRKAFKNDKVLFTITSSSFEDITVGTIEFSEKGEEKLIK